MDATQLFLREHARAHSKGVAEAEAGMNLENFVLDNLTDEQVRTRPADGMNSLLWIFWHMARSEDFGVNVIIAERPQVIECDGWSERLGLSRADIGTGMTDDEVAGFGIDVSVLREYRAAVGKRTREVVSAMPVAEWEEILPDAATERMLASGAVGPNAGWVPALFGGKSKALILAHVGSSHNFWHLGEAMTVRSLSGQRLPI
jgi:hypothetical protein